VDGHALMDTKEVRNVLWLLQQSGVEWQHGEFIGDVTRRAMKVHGLKGMPASMKYPDGSAVMKHMLTTDAYSTRRWYPHKIPGVITGTATIDIVHPVLPRTLSFRETARIMGYPDDWTLAPIGAKPGARLKYLGKGITVQCGEWVGEWTRRTLERDPGAWRGTKIGEHEYLIDVALDYKSVYNDRTGALEDSRPKQLVAAMDSRDW
jgi:site-specific DNA-cytosine methylase